MTTMGLAAISLGHTTPLAELLWVFTTFSCPLYYLIINIREISNIVDVKTEVLEMPKQHIECTIDTRMPCTSCTSCTTSAGYLSKTNT
jgi:hypothetical protein